MWLCITGTCSWKIKIFYDPCGLWRQRSLQEKKTTGYMYVFFAMLTIYTFKPTWITKDTFNWFNYFSIFKHQQKQLANPNNPILCFFFSFCLGLFQRDFYVISSCVSRGIPVATVIGGGYDKDVNRLALRHTIVHRAAIKVNICVLLRFHVQEP